MMAALATYAEMGGYAGFIWPAWLVAAVVLGGVLVASRRSLRARAAEVDRLEAALPRRRRAAGAGDDP